MGRFFKRQRLVSLCVLVLGMWITTNASASGWHAGKIDRIQLGFDKRIFVYTDTDHMCGDGKGRLEYYEDAGGIDMVASALLAYESQKKRVQFEIAECTGNVGKFKKIESVN